MDAPVRVLLVIDSLEVGGAERLVVDLALALRRKGHGVTIACSVAGDLSSMLEREGVPVRPLLGRLVKRRLSAAYAWKLRLLITGERFDVVHAHVFASAAAAATATLGTGVPLVITEHTEASWQGPSARWISRFIYSRAERIIAVSTPIKRRLIERDGVPASIITVVPNAVPPAPEDDHQPLRPAKLPGRPLVGVIARLQPEKGVATFLEAASRVASLLPETSFVIAGDGPLRRELEGLAEDLGMDGRVRFLGFRPDSPALMRSLEVLVVPSLTEGSPLVTLEALAAGVPVIASAVGGIPDQIRHDREGVLVPPGDAAALGEALLDLLRDSNRARNLGEAGRRRAATEFDHGTMVARIEEVYRSVPRRPGEPQLRTGAQPPEPSPRTHERSRS